MRIDSGGRFLVLGDTDAGGDKCVSIVDDISAAIRGWTPGTRLSPIWPVRDASAHGSETDPFSAENELIFLGPVRPAKLFAEIEEVHKGTYQIWLSTGCLNLILCKRTADVADNELEGLKGWAQRNGAVFEHWRVVDGVVSPSDQAPMQRNCTAELYALADLLQRSYPPSVLTAAQEYGSLMASSLTRAAAISPPDYDNLRQVAETVGRLIDARTTGGISTLDLQESLMTLNAALSRFASQAFSGIPPILQTECHFWTHSLLGTGTANLALMRLSAWIQTILGEARLAEQISALRGRTTGVPTLTELTEGDKLVNMEVIQAKPDGVSDPIVPLVTYFSGRDGFSSHLQTLSAPLTTISECNSWRSSLLTITHEVSHIFMESVLAEIYPPDGAEEVQIAARILTPQYQARDWHEAARQLAFEALLSMEQANRIEYLPVEAIPGQLGDILTTWSREAQEIVVHSFDFLYFYNSDVDFYIKSIWHSWCAIPGIEERVREYLLRTLCAISAPHLDLNPNVAFDAARRAAAKALSSLVDEGTLLGGYAAVAVKMLQAVERDQDLRRQLLEEYGARLLLVRLVKIFFYSERLAARLFSDPGIRGREGYDITPLDLEIESVGNPLRFLKEHLRDNPSEAESLWILLAIAYDDGAAGQTAELASHATA